MTELNPRTTASLAVAEALLQIGAVKLNVNEPFTWVSGIKSPIYCDNRLVNSDVAARDTVTNAFIEVIKERYAGIDAVAGVATGGISFAGYIAMRMEIPMVYVRQKPKEHGLKKQIEGELKPGAKVLVIEDHVSTGGSSMKAVDAVRASDAEFMGMMSVMQYGFTAAYELFEKEQVDYISLCDLITVVEVAKNKGMINNNEAISILDFKEDPKSWWSQRNA